MDAVSMALIKVVRAGAIRNLTKYTNCQVFDGLPSRCTAGRVMSRRLVGLLTTVDTAAAKLGL